MPWIIAGGSVLGSVAGGLLGGGGKQSTTVKPWAQVRPYLTGMYGDAAGIAGTPREYFPGQTYVDQLPSELQAFGALGNYNDQMFGAPFDTTMNAGQNAMTGNTTLGQMAGTLGPAATQQIMNSFGSFSQPSVGQRSIGQYGFSTTPNVSGYTPQYGQAGSLNATGALNSMMYGGPALGQASGTAGAANSLLQGVSGPNWNQYGAAMGAANSPLAGLGQADYTGLNAAVTAANAPILRQLNEEIIPGLNQRATFLNNETGGIKTLNSVLPDVMQRMSENATGLYNQERIRALSERAGAAGQMSSQNYGLMGQGLGQQMQAGLANSQLSGQASGQMYGSLQNAIQQAAQDRSQAAGLVGQGGLSAYGLGLQGAGLQSGLEQALAQMRMGTDVTNANLGMQADTTNANLGLQYQGQMQDYLSRIGGLAGQLGTAQGTDAARWGALFPSLAQSGATPYQNLFNFGGYQRGIAENALTGDVNRWNYQQQEPYDRYTWLNSILSGAPGQTSTTSGGTSASSVLGGALTGAQLGQMLAGGLGSTRGYTGLQASGYPNVTNDMSWLFNSPAPSFNFGP